MPARKLAPGALQRVVLEHFKGKTCFWAPSKTIAFLFNVYCYFCDFGADLGREHFWALLGSGFEVSGVSGVKVRGFGRSWDKRKNLVLGRRPKPLHFCLTFIVTFAISGRISAESTFDRFWG